MAHHHNATLPGLVDWPTLAAILQRDLGIRAKARSVGEKAGTLILDRPDMGLTSDLVFSWPGEWPEDVQGEPATALIIRAGGEAARVIEAIVRVTGGVLKEWGPEERDVRVESDGRPVGLSPGERMAADLQRALPFPLAIPLAATCIDDGAREAVVAALAKARPTWDIQDPMDPKTPDTLGHVRGGDGPEAKTRMPDHGGVPSQPAPSNATVSNAASDTARSPGTGDGRDKLAELVDRFSAALLDKLDGASTKYGFTDEWMRDDWRKGLCHGLLDHVRKGDPLDVAAYAAFAWHHGWSVSDAMRNHPVEGGGDAMSDRDGSDGTARLCRALYGRKEGARDYMGGSDARMLHDAADRIADLAARPAVPAGAVFGPVHRMDENDAKKEAATWLQGVALAMPRIANERIATEREDFGVRVYWRGYRPHAVMLTVRDAMNHTFGLGFDLSRLAPVRVPDADDVTPTPRDTGAEP